MQPASCQASPPASGQLSARSSAGQLHLKTASACCLHRNDLIVTISCCKQELSKKCSAHATSMYKQQPSLRPKLSGVYKTQAHDNCLDLCYHHTCLHIPESCLASTSFSKVDSACIFSLQCLQVSATAGMAMQLGNVHETVAHCENRTAAV